MDLRDQKAVGDLIRNTAPFRAVLTRVEDGPKMQRHQVRGLAGEMIEEAEYFQPYGFTSVPLVGSEVVALPVGGDRGHLILLAANDRGLRKKDMQSGEVGLYTAEGDFIHFKNGREIATSTKRSVLEASAEAVTRAPEIRQRGAMTAEGYDGGPTTFHIHGDLYVDGNIYATGDIVAGGVSLRQHTHLGCQGGQTGPPNGG